MTGIEMVLKIIEVSVMLQIISDICVGIKLG